MYSFNSRIRYSECDENETLTITSLLNYFQDCSTFQSEDLGVGVKALKNAGTLWVINYWQIDVIRMPHLCDEVTIHTRPYEIRGFFGKRNFYMKDERGDFLAKADSLWTYLSIKEGTPVRIPERLMEVYSPMEKLDMDYTGRKISIPAEASRKELTPIVVNEHMLDVNHHVNNGKYVEIATLLLSRPENFSRLRVEYRKQAFLEDVMYPVLYESDQGKIVFLGDKDGKPFSIVEFSGTRND